MHFYWIVCFFRSFVFLVWHLGRSSSSSSSSISFAFRCSQGIFFSYSHFRFIHTRVSRRSRSSPVRSFIHWIRFICILIALYPLFYVCIVIVHSHIYTICVVIWFVVVVFTFLHWLSSLFFSWFVHLSWPPTSIIRLSHFSSSCFKCALLECLCH